MMKTYKFRIYPSDAQIRVLESTLNVCRNLYNAMLQQRIYAYKSGKKANCNSQQDEIPEIKNAFPEYRSVHSQVLQDVTRRLDRAYDNFFRRAKEKKNKAVSHASSQKTDTTPSPTRSLDSGYWKTGM